MTKKVAPPLPTGWSERIIMFIGSTGFFGIVVGLFLFESVWIALTARYPQAFDEQFHFGLIRFYTHHVSPFLTSQPSSADQYGAISRDPSYLYHYILSFPLRFIQLFSEDTTVQVIWLRLINVALFGSSLFIFKRLFALTKTSNALINTVLLCFVLTPVVPLLASQVNYDNAMVPAVALAVYWTARLSSHVRLTKRWSWTRILLLITYCLLVSLVKYAFLPIFVGIGAWLLFEYRSWRKNSRPRSAVLEIVTVRHKLGFVGGIVILLMASGLFIQRYGINLVRYHTPLPECNQVLSVERCQAYSPWARNYMFQKEHIHLPLNQVATYPFVWLYHIMNELIFTISSGFNDVGAIDYHVGTQLILIEIVAWTVFALGFVALLWYSKRLAREPLFWLFTLLTALYIAALGGQNYVDYLRLGYPVAIHGRYILPLLPLMYLVMAQAFGYALQHIRLLHTSPAARKLVVAGGLSLILLFEGGGFITYILRSDPSWFWPQSTKAQTVNTKARTLLKHTVIDVHKY